MGWYWIEGNISGANFGEFTTKALGEINLNIDNAIQY